MNAPRVISLFSGAGGLDIGLESAGFQIDAATDFDGDCMATLEASQSAQIPVPGRESDRFLLQGARLIHEDIGLLSAADLAVAPPDLLIGGPPCQPFSSSGAQRAVRDPRGLLFQEFVRLASELQPRLVLFENVRGLVTARGVDGQPGGALTMVKREFEGIGYATSFALLNAADFGAPQRRVRLFMIGARDGELPEFPSRTHAKNADESALFSEGLKPWITLREFLDGRPLPDASEVVRPTPDLQRRLQGLPNGSGLKSPGPREATRPGGHWGYKQGTFIADLDKPARTVTASSSPDLVRDEDGNLRRLTLGECAALQGFPDRWVFVGSRSSRFKQVGNAVPSVFGQVLGRELLMALSRPGAGGVSSKPLPSQMEAAIAYARRDDARNGASRKRSPHYLGG